MRILTIGDSWTYGVDSSDPATKSWPAQMSAKYNVDIVNLARPANSNQRQIRICYEELARDSNYDYIIFPLAPASRTEILNIGKWQQVIQNQVTAWENRRTTTEINNIFLKLWHPWNDVQNTILQCFSYINTVASFGIPLFITGLALRPIHYTNELSWIENYKNDNDFSGLGMPLEILNISPKDLDRKLKSLKAMHQLNMCLQPEYFSDVVDSYMIDPNTIAKYGGKLFDHNKRPNTKNSSVTNNFVFRGGHPNDAGYAALADYFANKIGLIK